MLGQELLYDVDAGKLTKSILLIVAGGCLMVLSIFGSGISALLTLLAGMLGFRFRMLLVITILMLLGSLGLIVTGIRRMGQHKRFKEYVRVLGGREYCNLIELEERVKKNHRFVIKDLKLMVSRRWFRQGHLDHQNTCFMVTDQIYQQYLRIEEQKQQYAMDQEQKEAQLQREEKERKERLSPKAQDVIKKGEDFVHRIKACNDMIPGIEVSTKISQMEEVVDRIFDRIEQEPNLVDEVDKLLEYYLPTTIRLLEAYRELDAQPIGGENIQTAKAEIEATLDTLNQAFEKLLDSLFMEQAWDVSSDISVLKTILAQDGLKEEDMQVKQRRRGEEKNEAGI